LFREEDLRSPRDSVLFRDLVRINDPEVRRLADCLSRAVYKPLDQTPLLEELLANKLPATATIAGKLSGHGSAISRETAERDWSTAPPPIRVQTQPSTRMPARSSEPHSASMLVPITAANKPDMPAAVETSQPASREVQPDPLNTGKPVIKRVRLIG